MKFLAEQYCDDILSGRIVACQLVKLACQRHRDDLQHGHKRGLTFNEKAAKAAIAFFPLFLRHWKGDFAGQPVHLEPWQQFITWCIFGWMRADGSRRFRTVYVEVARKNGKTTWAAGVGLYMMIMDGEAGAEVYTAATKRDQARIAHRDAKEMVKRSPQLKKHIDIFKDNLSSEGNSSKFEPLGANYDSLDGLNSHCNIIDELHAHKTRDLYDVLEESAMARRQPITLSITTAGSDRETICYRLRNYVEQLLTMPDTFQDDSFFGIVYTLDKEDIENNRWDDESIWIKANPNMGISKQWSTMREAAAKAKAMTSGLNNFLRKQLNVWTQAVTRWLDRDKWDACGRRFSFDESDLVGRRAYGGLDLSNRLDFTAWVIVFAPLLPVPKEPDKDFELTLDHCYIIVPRFFIPEATIQKRVKKDRIPVDQWVKDGYVFVSPHDTVDYHFVVAQVEKDMACYDIHEVAFDRWGAAQVEPDLIEVGGEDFLIEFGQGFASMSAPSKEFEILVVSGQLVHGNNPALNWMADNVSITTDAAENIKPDKKKSIERIDGIVAGVMALDRATRHKPKRPAYEGRSLRVI